MKFRRPSKLQLLTHIAALIPLPVLVYDYLADNLGVNPIQAVQQRTGNIALILLLLSLACTPLNTVFRLPILNKLRRPLGLYGYMYAAVHLLNFLWLDYGFQFQFILLDLTEKRYIVVGLAAIIILTALAITSLPGWMKRMGKRWKRLHRLVYVVNGLVVLHFAWAIKGDFFRLQGDVVRPLLAGLIVVLLLAARVPEVRRRIAGSGQAIKERFLPRPTPRPAAGRTAGKAGQAVQRPARPPEGRKGPDPSPQD